MSMLLAPGIRLDRYDVNRSSGDRGREAGIPPDPGGGFLVYPSFGSIGSGRIWGTGLLSRRRSCSLGGGGLHAGMWLPHFEKACHDRDFGRGSAVSARKTSLLRPKSRS